MTHRISWLLVVSSLFAAQLALGDEKSSLLQAILEMHQDDRVSIEPELMVGE